MSTQNGQPLQVTPAGQWRKTVVMELPSGNVARLQPVSATAFIMEDGLIPDDLYPHMIQAISGSALTSDQIAANPDTLKAQILLAQQVTIRAFVEPRVVDGDADYDAGEISIRDVPDIDQQFVLQWSSIGGDEKDLLKRFRDQLARSLAAAQTGAGLRDSAE